MAKVKRRGFLGGLLTFGAFEAGVMTEVGVTSPTALVAMPDVLYVVTNQLVENHDEGWYFAEGCSVGDAYYSQAAAAAAARRLNVIDLRQLDTMIYMSTDMVDNMFCGGIRGDGAEKFLQDLRKYLPLMGYDDADKPPSRMSRQEMLEAVQELAADQQLRLDDENIPDEFVAEFGDRAGLSGCGVEARKIGDVDPAVIRDAPAV